MKYFVKKIFTLILLLACLAAGYFYRDILKEQYRHAKGMYYIYKGDQAYGLDNLGKTLDYYLLGLQLYPKHYEAWFNLGNIYTVHEDYFAAINAYEHAIEEKPNHWFERMNILARMNLGIVYLEDLGLFDEAIKRFDEVTQLQFFPYYIPFIYKNSIDSNKGRAYYNRGVAYRQKALYLRPEEQYKAYDYLGEAVKSYNNALKFLKDSYDVYYNRAVAYHLRGEFKEAGLDYCKAIEITPESFDAHYNLAILLRGLNKNRESLTELEKAAILISESSTATELQTTYIFNLLNEVTRRFITSDEYYTQKLTEGITYTNGYTYINGKLVADEDFENAIYNNFKTCTGIDYFKEDGDDEI